MMLLPNCGLISVYSFISTLCIALLLLLPFLNLTSLYLIIQDNILWILPSYFISINLILLFTTTGYDYKVAVRAAFLGALFSTGLFVSLMGSPRYSVFGCEFLTIAATNPKTLSVDSFILNHSIEYGIASVASWIEFWLEFWLVPGLKMLWPVSAVGLSVCVCGEILRKLAMLTARSNFNHIVQSTHEQGHELVTHGVYGLFRHPSYVGWFYWSIGTQLILVNPFCVVAYTLASWKFFNDRVTIEEVTLLYFFGEDYSCYQKTVGTGLPFISGYTIDT